MHLQDRKPLTALPDIPASSLQNQVEAQIQELSQADKGSLRPEDLLKADVYGSI